MYKTLFALQILTHLFHMTIMRGKPLLLLYILTDKENEVLRSQISCPRSYNYYVVSMDLNLDRLSTEYTFSPIMLCSLSWLSPVRAYTHTNSTGWYVSKK